MASFTNTNQLAQMLKEGWLIINDDNLISTSDFVAAIHPWTASDWTDGFTILTELGYFAGTENWVAQKTWVVDKTVPQGVAILKMIRSSANVAPTMLLIMLEAQRDVLVSQRAVVNDGITQVLNPFLQDPPDGTDQLILEAITEYRVAQITLRAQLDAQIEALDAQIAEQVILVEG